MRPVTRRLRLFAAVLGLAQSAIPALAVAHELGKADSAAPLAHAESEGTRHDAAAHTHDCAMCRNVVSKAGLPGAPPTGLGDGTGFQPRVWDAGPAAVCRDDVSAALPRAPPVG